MSTLGSHGAGEERDKEFPFTQKKMHLKSLGRMQMTKTVLRKRISPTSWNKRGPARELATPSFPTFRVDTHFFQEIFLTQH